MDTSDITVFSIIFSINVDYCLAVFTTVFTKFCVPKMVTWLSHLRDNEVKAKDLCDLKGNPSRYNVQCCLSCQQDSLTDRITPLSVASNSCGKIAGLLPTVNYMYILYCRESILKYQLYFVSYPTVCVSIGKAFPIITFTKLTAE